MNDIAEEYFAFIDNKEFPCIAAKAALARDQIRILVCEHLACPKDNIDITHFLYEFVEECRSKTQLYNSAVVIFKGPSYCSEDEFDQLMWLRLQCLSDLDARDFPWDQRVGRDPAKADFSFSLKEEAFYIIGLHPGASRRARRFRYPSLVFNPHDQFETLRKAERYTPIKESVRKRDVAYSGSVNPMLADFGKSSEAMQYSGKVYDKNWQCPFVSNGEDKHHPAEERSGVHH